MARYPTPAALTKFLQPYDRATRNLAIAVRSLVLEEMAPCYENIYDAYSAVAIGYGFSDRLKDGVFHIAVYSQHVNLGFNHGVALPDHLGILKGSGSQIRHISIETPEDLARPEIRSYIKRARAMALDDARKLGEPMSEQPKRVVSTVKAIYPRKRRPAPSSDVKKKSPSKPSRKSSK